MIDVYRKEDVRKDTVDVCKQIHADEIKKRDDLINEFIDYLGDECRFDHHGYCQEHRLEKFDECFVARAKKITGYKR